MARQECDYYGSGIVRLDYSNAIKIMDTENGQVALDSTGKSYTPTKPGAIICSFRLGNASTAKIFIGTVVVSDIYTADTTSSITGELPTYTSPCIFVDTGDTVVVQRTWGKYAWMVRALFIPYK